jgi:hypothetical protein
VKRRPRPLVHATAALAALVLLPTAATAAAPPPVFEGTWIATAGQQTFAGRWSAQALPGQPDSMQGSWELRNSTGEVVTKGTWSARRARRGFTGKWWARVANGATLGGTFDARLPGFKGKTLESMIAETKTKQISGFWRMSILRGAWYLKGPAAP